MQLLAYRGYYTPSHLPSISSPREESLSGPQLAKGTHEAKTKHDRPRSTSGVIKLLGMAAVIHPEVPNPRHP